MFGAKQAWACAFGALLLARWPSCTSPGRPGAPVARNDVLTLAAVALQVGMLVFGLETVRELRVVLVFHVVGTVMEVFKTHVGSWEYGTGGWLVVAGVPLFSGFMYGAVGSYMVRVVRLFDLRFDRYPRQWLLVVVAVGIYANFFGHHFVWDARWLLLALVVALFARTTMHVRVHRATLRMPVLLAMSLVALFIWLAEDVATGRVRGPTRAGRRVAAGRTDEDRRLAAPHGDLGRPGLVAVPAGALRSRRTPTRPGGTARPRRLGCGRRSAGSRPARGAHADHAP